MFQKPSTKPAKPATKPVNKKDDTSAQPRKQPPTVIGTDIRMLGNIISDGVIDLGGQIEGNIKAESAYVREQAVVTGDIAVHSEVHVFGTVQGVIKAPRVCIYPDAHIEGAIIHRSLTIEDGAYVDAQFKPFDAQTRIGHTDSSMEALINQEVLRRDPVQHAADTKPSPEGDYDALKDLKLIS